MNTFSKNILRLILIVVGLLVGFVSMVYMAFHFLGGDAWGAIGMGVICWFAFSTSINRLETFE